MHGLKPETTCRLEFIDETRARTQATLSGKALRSDFEMRLPKRATSLLLRYKPAAST